MEANDDEISSWFSSDWDRNCIFKMLAVRGEISRLSVHLQSHIIRLTANQSFSYYIKINP